MPNQQNQQHAFWGIDLLFLTLVIGILFFLFLGTRPLFAPDEGRYAEIAREMASSGHYITPYLNGIKYFEKPILFYWLGAAAIKVGGLNLWAIRSVNALLGLIGCLATYCTARKLYDRKTGLWSALILSSSFLYFVMAHMVSLDLPITLFLALCLYSFLLGSQNPPGTTRRFYCWGAAIAAALAVLDKGLIGVVFPGLIIATWLGLTGRWRELRHFYLPSSIIIFIIIAAPWHIIVGIHNPEFYYFYFIEQQFLRYATSGIGHEGPVWFFIPTLLLGFLPWTIFLPQALIHHFSWQHRNQYQVPLFFILWATIIFLFFSFSQSKLIPYILPIFPPLAILTGHYVAERFNRSLIILFCLSAILSVSFMAVGTRFDTRSIRPLAILLKPILTPEDEVITYNQYYQDLPFYLERRVSILNWKNELSFGMQHQNTRAWMLDDATFWKRYDSSKRLFIFLSISEYKKLPRYYPGRHFYLISTTKNTALISNHPYSATLDMLTH
jgi:4-amino-4-deoxy-L-arabinose transferase-like glycosyltransferase